MTARKTKSEQDDKTVGKDESKTTQTTDQQAEAAENVPTKAEKRDGDDTDVKGAADGTVVGGTVDGKNKAFEPEDEDDYEDWDAPVEDDEVEGATGTVAERNLEGDEFDVPYVYVTAADLARTSDADDPAKDWTAQHASGERETEDGEALDPVALVPVEGTPGQTFRVRELPNREVAEKAGIDYDQWIAGLPVRADVPNEAPRKGIPA